MLILPWLPQWVICCQPNLVPSPPITETTCLKGKNDNPVFWTRSCSEAIIIRWQLSFPLPRTASLPKKLQMNHPTRNVSAALHAHWEFREEGSRNAEIYAPRHARWHTETVSTSTLEPAGSQLSLGLSEAEALIWTPWQIHNKRKQEIILLKEGLWGNARMPSYFWLEEFLLKLLVYLILAY